VECKNIGDASNNRGNWNHFKILQTILSSVPGKHNIKELQKTAVLGTAHTAGSANVEAQQSLILQTALYAPLAVRAE
jgi:hypothetical protein